MFFWIAPKQGAAYRDKEQFGEKVKLRFPKSTEDIDEAYKCFCFGRYTASVFHLMRVMEIAVQGFGVSAGATVPSDKPWGNILQGIDAAVRMMPRGTPQEKKRHEDFSEVAAYLHHVKDAWRNTTMHPKNTYTEEEAEHLLSNVKTFMRGLAELI